MTAFQRFSSTGHLFAGNAAFLEAAYEQYLADPAQVHPQLRQIFQDSSPAHPTHPAASTGSSVAADRRQSAVSRLIARHRLLGARRADVNPLGYEPHDIPELTLAGCGLSESDLDAEFETDIVGLPRAPLKDILAAVQNVYCGTLAPEFMHISDGRRREWLREKFESRRIAPPPPREMKLRLLERLTAAETLEKYLHTRYVGQKRFSLEGGEALIPMLDVLLQYAGENGVVESVIGMAHRGRLNVLVNILGKRPADLFREFEGKQEKMKSGSGDVKYHMGFSSSLKTSGGQMHLALAFNPSHLEIANPVVAGSVRARQDRRGDSARRSVLPVQIHGDAAFAGQGVVMETLNLSQVRGFKVGGSVHIIVNNQIGFTTSAPDDARSTFFCSDVAKMIEAPIIHVNGEDPEAAAFAARAALDYRNEFGADIVIDMVCYRRHGHNEQDEPLMTQPLMYRKVKTRPGPPAVYAEKLRAEGALKAGEDAEMVKARRAKLEKGDAANDEAREANKSDFVDWAKYTPRDWDVKADTAASRKIIALAGKTLSQFPPGFTPHNQLKNLAARRAEMAAGKRPLDWGMGENLAYAALLLEGHPVRLSGQDCGRGTFSHRHAVWHDQKRDKRDGGSYIPLRNLSPKQAEFLVIDSLLSEEAVLGFEYGYAYTAPDKLVIWEAQFGDFANGAQVVIDQFIAAGESKWGRFCGLTMLLPHGYEGQGPEHSSARLERYLQLCAEYNIQVCVPSTPAQMFHLLRRQMIRGGRRPLVVMTPKSLLRHPEATSQLAELTGGRFFPVIGEADKNVTPRKATRLVFCSGKVYYDVLAVRRERKLDDVAVVRLEQLYPFPHKYVQAEIDRYKNAHTVVWCQEEPGNQGAWHRLQHYFRRHLRKGQKLAYALRPSAASPAAGYADIHKIQQQEVVDAALTPKPIAR